MKQTPYFQFSPYEKLLPKQMELYCLAAKGMTKELLKDYMNSL